MIKERSIRSPRVTKSSIPFSMSGRLAVNVVSSVSEYNSRTVTDPPVARRQKESDSPLGIVEMLSYGKSQWFCELIIRSRLSFGQVITSTARGSRTFLRVFDVVVLALPCSPVNTKIG